MSNSQGRKPGRVIHLGHNGAAAPRVPLKLAAQAADISDHLAAVGLDLAVGDPVMVMLAHQDPILGVVLKVWPDGTEVRAHGEGNTGTVPWAGSKPLITVKAFRPMRFRDGMPLEAKDAEIEEVRVDKLPWVKDVVNQAVAAGYPAAMAKQVHAYAIVKSIDAI